MTNGLRLSRPSSLDVCSRQRLLGKNLALYCQRQCPLVRCPKLLHAWICRGNMLVALSRNQSRRERKENKRERDKRERGEREKPIERQGNTGSHI